MSTDDPKLTLAERWSRVIAPTLGVHTAIPAVRAEGPWVEAADGRRYLDFASGTATTNIGHNHPAVIAAARAQMDQMVHSGGVFRYESIVALAERLATIAPGDIGSFFFLNGGSEAIEGAVKLARRVTGRHGVVVFRGGFHGRTQGSVGYTTSKSAYRSGYAPLGASVYVAPFPTPYRWGVDMDEAVDRTLAGVDDLHRHELPANEVACYLIEPVQGEGGYHPAGQRLLEGLRERADQYGALLLYDEVQTGFGRTGEWFAAQTYGVNPDVIAMAKGIANGFPVSAIGASPELMAKWPTGGHGTTFGGNPIACAAGCAVIDTVNQDGLLARGRQMGERITHRLKALEAEVPEIAEVRGPGLMIGIEFADPQTRAPLAEVAHRVVAAAQDEDLVLIECGPEGNVVRFIPPMVTSDDDLNLGLTRFEAAVGRALG
jgi:4-aminobutyrate aminotransferase